MIDLKKKCWREKVTAEVTVALLQQFASDVGSNMTAAEAATFLNENGRAQGLWMRMMEAGEEFIKASLEAGQPQFHPAPATARQSGPMQYVS